MHFSTITLAALIALAAAAPTPNDYASASASASASAGAGGDGSSNGSPTETSPPPSESSPVGAVPSESPTSGNSASAAAAAAAAAGAGAGSDPPSPTSTATDGSPQPTDMPATGGGSAPGTGAFTPGTCSFQMTERMEAPLHHQPRSRSAVIPAVYDGATPAHVVGSLPATGFMPEPQTYTIINTGLPGVLTVTQRPKKFWRIHDVPVTFRYNDRPWEEDSSQCKLGPWDQEYWGMRIIACWFEC